MLRILVIMLAQTTGYPLFAALWNDRADWPVRASQGTVYLGNARFSATKLPIVFLPSTAPIVGPQGSQTELPEPLVAAGFSMHGKCNTVLRNLRLTRVVGDARVLPSRLTNRGACPKGPRVRLASTDTPLQIPALVAASSPTFGSMPREPPPSAWTCPARFAQFS